MIKPITEINLIDCLNIMKMSYEEGALKFGQTEENCPYRGRTRLPLDELRREFLEGCLMYGYFYEDMIVGFLSLTVFNDSSTMGINDIAILPEYQSKGFGSELIQFSKEEAKRLNCEKLRLGMIADNLQLKKWYEKHGFKTVRLVKYDTVTFTVGKMELVL